MKKDIFLSEAEELAKLLGFPETEEMRSIRLAAESEISKDDALNRYLELANNLAVGHFVRDRNHSTAEIGIALLMAMFWFSNDRYDDAMDSMEHARLMCGQAPVIDDYVKDHLAALYEKLGS